MSEAEVETFRACTGRAEAPGAAFAEAWLVCGRRSGKSFIMALVAVFLACFRDYRPHLGPGERATIMVVAADRKQARTVLRYVRGLLGVPPLVKLVENDTAESIELAKSAVIEVGTASHRSIRGYTVAAALCDELAFWPTEDSAAPDVEILAALRPAMATIPNAMLLCASSPYARRGALWDAFRRYFGKDDPTVLVWKAPTRVMNPSIPQLVIDEAIERDPASAAAEYGAEFRTDVETFIAREIVDQAITRGLVMRPPLRNQSYRAFVDPSGGSSDSFTLAISHREGERYILDLTLERRPPFSPQEVVREFAQVIKNYRCSRVVGDRYAARWPPSAFAREGVSYEASEKTRSELYLTALPLLTSGLVDLVDDKKLVSQLCGLERRTSRSGRDTVDHGLSGHDDVCNASMGALVQAMARQPMQISDAALALAGSDTRYARQLRDVARLQRGEIDDFPAAWL